MTNVGRLIEVEWWDSERVTMGWAPRKDYLAAMRDRVLYRTAGYYMGEDDQSILVSHSRSGRDTFNDAMVIPRAVIHARRWLGPKP